MGQLMFSRCVACGRTYEHEKPTHGYGPLYCPECREKIRLANAAKRQREYRNRKSARRG